MLKILPLICIVIVSSSEAGRRGKYTLNLSLLIELLKIFLIFNDIKNIK
jgi:hypothetical protein